MPASVRPVTEFKPKNEHYVDGLLERKSAEHKEDVARWAKDHPDRAPGDSGRTHKSFSRQRYGASQAYLDNYDKIDWRRTP